MWKNTLMRSIAWMLIAVGTVGCSTIRGWFDWSEDEDANEPAPLVTFTPEVKIDRLWSSGVGQGQGKIYNFLTPVIDGDRIYALGSDGVMAVLNRHNGRQIWKRNLKLPMSGGVGLGAGLLALGSSNGEVLLLDADNGAELWRVAVSGEVLSPPQTDGSVVVVQSYDGKLRGLSVADGSELWVYENPVPVLTIRGTGTPLIDGRLVMAGFANGKVVALNVKTGVLQWEARVAIAQGRSEIDRIIDVDGEMLLFNEVLYAVSYQGRLVAIEVGSGRKLWQQDASSAVGIDQGFGNVYVSEDSGSVVAFYRTGQGVRWEQPRLEKRRLSAPKVIKGFVAVGDFEGYVHLLSQTDGHFVGRKQVDGKGVRASMLAVDDVLYVFGNSGKLTALRVSG